MTGDGLVGKVASTTSGTAQVTLITDASSAVSVQIMPDGALLVSDDSGNRIWRIAASNATRGR